MDSRDGRGGGVGGRDTIMSSACRTINGVLITPFFRLGGALSGVDALFTVEAMVVGVVADAGDGDSTGDSVFR